MTMKTAQDISPSAIVCVSLAMLIGNMYMGQISEYMGGHKAAYVNEQPSAAAKTTLVDVSEGRRLERLPDYLGSSSGTVSSTYSQDVHSEAIQTAQEKEVAVHKVADLLPLSLHKEPLKISDGSTVLVIMFCLILGVAVACTDVQEMSVEDDTAEVLKNAADDNATEVLKNTEKEPGQTAIGDAHQLPSPKCIASLIATVVVAGIGLLLLPAVLDSLVAPDPPVEHEISQELKELARTSELARPVLASDTFVMLVLAASSLLAVIIAKVDFQEMVEELCDASSSGVEPEQEEQPLKVDAPYDNSKVNKNPEGAAPLMIGNNANMLQMLNFVTNFLGVAGVLASVLLSYWTCLDFSIAFESSAEDTSFRELRQLASDRSSNPALASDTVMFLLGACALLAVVIMKVDIREMAEQLHEESSSEGQGAEEPLEISAEYKKSAVAKNAAKKVVRIAAEDSSQHHTFHLFVKSILCICALALSALGLLLSSASFETAVGQELSPLRASAQELNILAAGPVQQHLSFAPDRFVMLVLGASVVLAVVVMKIDIDEMAEEATSEKGQPLKVLADKDTSAVTKHVEREVAPSTVNDIDQLPRGKSVGFCISAVAFAVAICSHCIICICEVGLSALIYIYEVGLTPLGLLFNSASFETASAQELSDLVAGSVQQYLSLAPDSFVVLVLGAFALLAVFVMKIDMEEMAKEATVHTDEDAAAVVEHVQKDVARTMFNTDQLSCRKRVLCISAVALSAIVLLLYQACVHHCEMVSSPVDDERTQELRDFLVSVYQHSLIAPDSLVMFALGACSMLAVAVMKTDISEMEEELHETADHIGLDKQQLEVSAMKDITQMPASTTKAPRSQKNAVIFPWAVVVVAVGFLLSNACLDCLAAPHVSAEDGSTQELMALGAGSAYQHPRLLPDSFIMLLLIASTALAVIIMKLDICEMAEKLHEA